MRNILATSIFMVIIGATAGADIPRVQLAEIGDVPHRPILQLAEIGDVPHRPILQLAEIGDVPHRPILQLDIDNAAFG
jgi:hypothetical protein